MFLATAAAIVGLAPIIGLAIADCFSTTVSIAFITPNWQFFLVVLAWIVLELLIVFSIGQRRATWRRDFLFVLYTGGAMALVSGLAARVVIAAPNGIFFFPCFVGYFILYSLAFWDLQKLHIVLTHSLPLAALAPCLVLLLVFGVFLFSAWRVSVECFLLYLVVLALLALAHAALLLDGQRHVHHWYYPVPLALLCIFNTNLASLTQAALLAVHVHGLAFFGPEGIFHE